MCSLITCLLISRTSFLEMGYITIRPVALEGVSQKPIYAVSKSYLVLHVWLKFYEERVFQLIWLVLIIQKEEINTDRFN